MRSKTIIPLLLAGAWLCLAGALALAGDEPATPEDLAKMSGKDLYKRNCKGCHEEESPHGEYTPMSLIQEQWERFFDEQYVETHEAVVDSSLGGGKVTELITPEILEKIREFCIEGAADSEHPMTCG